MYKIPEHETELVMKALYLGKAMASLFGYKTVEADIKHAIVIMQTLLKAN